MSTNKHVQSKRHLPELHDVRYRERERLDLQELFTLSMVWAEEGPRFTVDRAFAHEWGLLGTHSNGFNGSPFWHGWHYCQLGETMPTRIR